VCVCVCVCARTRVRENFCMVNSLEVLLDGGLAGAEVGLAASVGAAPTVSLLLLQLC
jgi:hypothetical protein